MLFGQPCQLLQWDTEFFGKRIARVHEHRLTLPLVNLIFDWCAQHKIDCLYFLADSDHAETTRLAEDNGFRFMDIRLTFQQKLGKPDGYNYRQPDDIIVRTARHEDVAALEAIARISYTDTRYYYDPCFSDELASALYQTWIKRSYEGYANIVFVAEIESHPIGYISCNLSQDTMQGQIGLIGVAAAARGRGVGWLLVNCALRWFAEQGVSEVKVVTQGRNIAAQRMYQRSGFLTHTVQLWYHKWFQACE
jgi:dTDP-4-amino-4,6-dideoxy-D-galactose acyltransferase